MNCDRISPAFSSEPYASFFKNSSTGTGSIQEQETAPERENTCVKALDKDLDSRDLQRGPNDGLAGFHEDRCRLVGGLHVMYHILTTIPRKTNV